MGKRSPGPMSYIREASALRNIKLCYAGRSFSIRVVIRCLHINHYLLTLLADQGAFMITVTGMDTIILNLFEQLRVSSPY